MLRKKNTSLYSQSEFVSARLRPRSGVSDSQVLQWLADHGISEVNQLAEGFISVKASRKDLHAAEKFAEVEVQPHSQLHQNKD